MNERLNKERKKPDRYSGWRVRKTKEHAANADCGEEDEDERRRRPRHHRHKVNRGQEARDQSRQGHHPTAGCANRRRVSVFRFLIIFIKQ